MNKYNALAFTINLLETAYKPHKEVPKGLDPTFYHTLDYDREVKFINDIKETINFLQKLKNGENNG